MNEEKGHLEDRGEGGGGGVFREIGLGECGQFCFKFVGHIC
jgi:hypothetical protein